MVPSLDGRSFTCSACCQYGRIGQSGLYTEVNVPLLASRAIPQIVNGLPGSRVERFVGVSAEDALLGHHIDA
jgi:hypothetical protein